jgi:cytosine deaminase
MTDHSGVELRLAGAVLADGRRVHVRLAGGRVAEVAPATGPAPVQVPAPVETVDLDGWLLLPAPVEAHTHLDKALTADRIGNPTGDLAGAVTAWLRYRPSLRHDDVVRRATTAVGMHVAHGATVIRSHVDIGGDIGLRAVHALLAVREAVREICTLQLVAFVGVPLSGIAGAEHRALLRAALDAGVDVVGGCPYLDPDPAACVRYCLGAATEHRRPVDLHVDEVLDPAVRSLHLLADAVGDGHPYGVVAAHGVSLSTQPVEEVGRLAERLAAAGIAVVCLPQTNLYLQGRDRTIAGQAGRPRGLAPLDLLRAGGVTVAAGGDNLQDPFNPLGRGDPLETAALLVTAAHQHPDDAYRAVSDAARTALGLPPVTVAAGAPADLLAVRAPTLRAAIATAGADRLVIRAGRIVARTTSHRDLPALDPDGTVPGAATTAGGET